MIFYNCYLWDLDQPPSTEFYALAIMLFEDALYFLNSIVSILLINSCIQSLAELKRTTNFFSSLPWHETMILQSNFFFEEFAINFIQLIRLFSPSFCFYVKAALKIFKILLFIFRLGGFSR